MAVRRTAAGRRPGALLGAVAILLAACGRSGASQAGGTVHRTVPLGGSVQGRPISAVELGDPRAARRVLVVGCLHGDEPAGAAVADALAAGPRPAHADLWIVPVLNPDGMAAGTRGNAHGVDLNRNFPSGWRRIGAQGSAHHPGAAPLSEPESAAAARLVRRVRPTVAIWFHQHLAVVDGSQGPKDVERRFARDAGLPLRSLPDYPGSATGWENTIVGGSAFVVELPGGRPSPEAVRRYASAVRRVTGN